MGEKIDRDFLVETAKRLGSEQGENPEYDRALVELVGFTLGYSVHGLEAVRNMIFGPRVPDEKWDYGRYAVVIEREGGDVAAVYVVEGKTASETQRKAVELGRSLSIDNNVTWDWFDALSLGSGE